MDLETGMDLEMMLIAKRYVGEKTQVKVFATKGGEPLELVNPIWITEDVGYWCKADQIHRWFVENVQRGNDKYLHVKRAKLRELLAAVRTVLASVEMEDALVIRGYDSETGLIIEEVQRIADPTVAREILPTGAERFLVERTDDGRLRTHELVGSGDYDDWYVQVLRDTEEILVRALAMDGVFFEYHVAAT